MPFVLGGPSEPVLNTSPQSEMLTPFFNITEENNSTKNLPKHSRNRKSSSPDASEAVIVFSGPRSPNERFGTIPDAPEAVNVFSGPKSPNERFGTVHHSPSSS